VSLGGSNNFTMSFRLCVFAALGMSAAASFGACKSTADNPVDIMDASEEGLGGTDGSGGTSDGAGGGIDSGPDADAGSDALSDCLSGAVVIDPAAFPVCPTCPDAHCVPASALEPDQVAQLGDCPGGGGKCVPDAFIRSGGKFVVASCRSLIGAEGRCLPSCLPQIDVQKDRLPLDSCKQGELCAPCYDPTNGSDTGACKVSCDPGPKEPAKQFDKCCGDLGLCVPKDSVPTTQASSLGVDVCTGTDMLCAPATLVDPSAVPPTCESVGGAEGRCLPACLPAVASQQRLLPQSTCGEGHLCAPCYDPRTGEETPACGLNGDTPKEPPFVFEKCCAEDGGVTGGTCVPLSVLSPAQVSSLPVDTCPDATWRCAPNAKVADLSAKFPECVTSFFCQSDGGGCWLGACLPACFIPADVRSVLVQKTCATGELCAPCEHPLQDAAPTGACE
jgi:hypothetical protein